MRYHFKIHSQSHGFWAECMELKGCVTQAESKEALQRNMYEALNLYLDESPDSDVVFSAPAQTLKGKNIVEVEVDPRIAFSFSLRRLRLKRQLTQREVAKKMGFNNIYSYQRLEKGKTANPELSTLIRIRSVFPDFDLNEILDS